MAYIRRCGNEEAQDLSPYPLLVEDSVLHFHRHHGTVRDARMVSCRSSLSSVATSSLEEEVKASFQAYDSLWNARADQLATVSLVLSRLSQVRAAFGTGDKATIRDAAGEVWDKLARSQHAVPDCRSGGRRDRRSWEPSRKSDRGSLRARGIQAISQAGPRTCGAGRRLYQIVVTPVYVASGTGRRAAGCAGGGNSRGCQPGQAFKTSTGGSDFVFLVNGNVEASTLDALPSGKSKAGEWRAREERVSIAGSDYYQFSSALGDVQGNPVGELRILRSFDAARDRIAADADVAW